MRATLLYKPITFFSKLAVETGMTTNPYYQQQKDSPGSLRFQHA